MISPPWKLHERKSDFLIKNKTGCVLAQIPKCEGGTMEPEMKPTAQAMAHAAEMKEILQNIFDDFAVQGYPLYLTWKKEYTQKIEAILNKVNA